MDNPIKQTQETIRQIQEFIKLSPWRNDYNAILDQLIYQTEKPCVLAIAGRVNAGKSSFLNALLGGDFAMVGTTETTATINYFRYSTGHDPERPILIVWENGYEEYKPKSFLDELQGNSQAALDKAKSIKRIEFLLDDPILKEVTLVDTPGIDAIVGDGEGGDGHQQVTDSFFLREKHEKESRELTDSADAVIYLTYRVANTSAQKFMQDFLAASGRHSSAMNAIGVMAKIDIDDAVLEARQELATSIAEKMRKELNTVIPVSAGIWRALDKLKEENKLEELQQSLKRIPTQKVFNFLLDDAETFLEDERIYYKHCKEADIQPLTPDERKKLLGDLPWRVFVVIARYLYHYPLEEAVEKLTDIAGVNQVKGLLLNHFFRRSKIIRCSGIVRRLHEILDDISRNGLYDLRKEVESRTEFDEFISSHPMSRMDSKIPQRLRQFVSTHIKTREEVEQLVLQLEGQLSQLDFLQENLRQTDDNFSALTLLEKNRDLFSEEELAELQQLFGLYVDDYAPEESVAAGRQSFWRMQMNLSMNPDLQEIAKKAMLAYGNIQLKPQENGV